MKSMLKAGAVSAVALVSLWAAAGAQAEDKPDNGVPEESIAQELPYDAARASLSAAGIKYGVNYTAEYFNVASGGLSRGSTYNGLVMSTERRWADGWQASASYTWSKSYGLLPSSNASAADRTLPKSSMRSKARGRSLRRSTVKVMVRPPEGR